MVDLADLQKANMLAAEKASIAHAIEQLNGDGRIVAMTIAPKPAEDMMFMPIGGVQVNTAYMDAPPQMLESVKQLLQQRQGEIEEALIQLGVTL